MRRLAIITAPNTAAWASCRTITPNLHTSYEIAFGKRTAFELTLEVGRVGLPKDREVDTVRALFNLAKREDDRTVGKKTLRFALLAEAFRRVILEPELKRLDAVQGQNLKDLFLSYYTEFISPPSPLLGFAALNVIRRVTDQTQEFACA